MKKLHDFTVFLAKFFAHLMYFVVCFVVTALCSSVVLYLIFAVLALVKDEYVWSNFIVTLFSCSITLSLIVFILTEVRVIVFKGED